MSIDRSFSMPGWGGTSRAGRIRVWALAGLAMIAVTLLATWTLVRMRAAPTPITSAALRLSLTTPAGLTPGAGAEHPFGLALAPDGRRLVFPATKAGPIQLWLHDLTTGEAQALPGTDNAVSPFWAPDGLAIGFFADGRLRVVTLETGLVTDLAAAFAPRGGAWHPSGDILFASDDASGLSRRRASDGSIEAFTSLDSGAGDVGHRYPSFVGGGRYVVFHARSREAIREGLWLAPFDNPVARTRLVASDAHALVIGETLLYASNEALVAQRLDLETRALVDRAVLVASPVGRGPHGELFATGGDETVIVGAPASGLRELRWVDRQGVVEGSVGEAMDGWDVRIAPRGDAVAVTRIDPQLKTLDIWTYDGDRPLPRKISLAIDADESPVWSRDGSQLAWTTARRSVVVRGAGAELPDERVHTFDNPVRVTDWSPDGRWIVVSESRPDTRDDVWLLPADGQGEPRPYARSPFREMQGTVSPDGRWMAYASDESGRFEIYVDSFPVPGTRGRLTGGGGADPRWKADGGELYVRRGREVYAVTPTFSRAVPEASSSTRLFDAAAEVRAYDASRDGQRFLLNVPATEQGAMAAAVVVHWRSVLPAPGPAPRRPR
jgi:eukaryotic-like serine/threonine-protein kinase